MSPLTESTRLTLAKTSYPDIRNGIVTNGLVLNLDAGQTASYPGAGTTWTDLSGNGNNGTLVNGPTYSSANGGSIVFDGTNDTVTTGTSSGLTPPAITFSIWVKRTAAWPNGSCLFWGKPAADFAGNGFYLETLTGSSGFGTNYTAVIFNGDPGPAGAGGSATASLTTSTIFPLNLFVNFAFTMASGSVVMYVNGTAINSTTLRTPTITANTATKYLMHNSPGYNAYTPGEVGQLSIYNRALTAAEVQQNFNCLRMRYGI